LFKIGMSLVLAVIAAFVIVLAGFLNEVRVGTMLLRGLLGFVVTGVVGALLVTVFEARNLETAENSSRERDEDEQMSYIPSDDETEHRDEEEAGEEAGFQPLTDQNLEHLQPPES